MIAMALHLYSWLENFGKQNAPYDTVNIELGKGMSRLNQNRGYVHDLGLVKDVVCDITKGIFYVKQFNFFRII